MNLRSQAIVIAIVAAPATLLGHSFTYTAGAVSLADGRHTYFLPVLQASVTLALGLAFALIVRALFLPPLGPRKLRPVSSGSAMTMLRQAQHDTIVGSSGGLLGLWAIFAFTQCALFVSLESLEGYRAGVLGCAVQCAVAFVSALLVLWFGEVLQRCEEVALACGIYLPRPSNGPGAITDRSICQVPANRLNERCGVRRFQRPPPGL